MSDHRKIRVGGAIATIGSGGPHLAACWTRNILPLGAGADEILIPAWRLKTTEENLSLDPRVELLFVARDGPHTDGQGQGCAVIGTAEVRTVGLKAEAIKNRFPWAHGVLVVKVSGLKTHLP
jgi:hypothetical protein